MIWDDETLPAPVRNALEAHRAVARAIHDKTSPGWDHLELTMGQLKAMMALSTIGAVNVGGLAERLELSKPTTSILVDRLVQLGYVERTEDAEDRRRTLVALTTKGNELVAQLQQSGGRRMAQWLARLAPADLDALTRGLRALAAAVEHDAGGRADSAEAVSSAQEQLSGIAED